MEPFIITAVAVAAVGVLASTALLIVTERRRRRREKVLTDMLSLANEAFQADLAKSFPARIEAVEVDPESPLGRQLAKMLGPTPTCGCPNCEEERRIKHAQSKRDGE